MYAERYFLHVSFRLQAFAAFRQSFFLTTAGSPEEKDSKKKKVMGGGDFALKCRNVVCIKPETLTNSKDFSVM